MCVAPGTIRRVTPQSALLAVFVVGSVAFAFVWARALRRLPPPRELRPGGYDVAVGAVTNFFDTLGIGSYATTTALFRLGARLGPKVQSEPVSDRVLPGTLNVGHCLPSFVQAILAVTFIEVDALTLVAMVAAAVVGAWFGAGMVARLPLRAARIGLGCALLVAAGLLTARQEHWFPAGGEALGLRGVALLVAVLVNGVLGALMTLGFGLYAPCMILVGLLGMNLKAAFPIMMSSCALLMPVGSLRFFQTADEPRVPAYAPRAAMGLTVGGIPAVLVAALLVRSLPLDAVRWLVVVVVTLTAVTMLRAARR